MDWNELIGVVEPAFDTVVREDGATFIICPECGEPIYEDDYRGDGLCPCCEFNFNEI